MICGDVVRRGEATAECQVRSICNAYVMHICTYVCMYPLNNG